MRRILLGLLLCSIACGDDSSPDPDTGTATDAGEDGATDGGSDATPDTGPMCDDGEVPLARGEHAAIYDAERGRILVHGGNTAFPEMCRPRTEVVDELWAYDLRCQTWSQLSNSGGPGMRTRHSAVLDSAGGRAFFFGGRRPGSGGNINFNDVWSLDLATLAWTEIATTGSGPEERSHAALAFDSTRNRLVVFGGNTSTSGLSIIGTEDTWALDLDSGAWTQLADGSGPPPRYAHGWVQDDSRLYVFGGSPDFDGPFQNDLWAFDLASDTWTQLAGGGPSSPPTRFGAALYVTDSGIIMVAGHDSTDLGNINDLWTFDFGSESWTEVVRGDLLTGMAAGLCDFPADFTDPDEDAPERRHYFGAVQTDTTGYMVFGKTDCGNANDVWTVDLNAPGWALDGSATTSGEACNRSGRTDCTTLCF